MEDQGATDHTNLGAEMHDEYQRRMPRDIESAIPENHNSPMNWEVVEGVPVLDSQVDSHSLEALPNHSPTQPQVQNANPADTSHDSERPITHHHTQATGRRMTPARLRTLQILNPARYGYPDPDKVWARDSSA